MTAFSTIEPWKTGMKRPFATIVTLPKGDALRLFLTVLLFFPSFSSVLCIAPGDHIAIEDISALCCVSSAGALRSQTHTDAGFGRPGSCSNCTDVLLAADETGVLSQLNNHLAAGPPDGEVPGMNLLPDRCATQCRSGKMDSADVPLRICSSVPLRC